METIEGTAPCKSRVIPLQATTDAARASNKGSYEAVRFNAMTHGILSKLAVLAHEDHDEFAELLQALVDEHQPAGMTERHLVEELAAIIWRKRRVLLAEGARINEGLKSVLHSPKTMIPAAAPFERDLSDEHVDLPHLLNATSERIAKPSRRRTVIWLRPARRQRYLRSVVRMPTRRLGGRCFQTRASGGTCGSVKKSTRLPLKVWRSSSVNRWNLCASAWCGKPDIPRRSRRKLWAQGCKRTGWSS